MSAAPAGTGWRIDTIAITNRPDSSPVNHAPSLPAQSNRTVNELASLVVTNTASDVDVPSQIFDVSVDCATHRGND